MRLPRISISLYLFRTLADNNRELRKFHYTNDRQIIYELRSLMKRARLDNQSAPLWKYHIDARL